MTEIKRPKAVEKFETAINEYIKEHDLTVLEAIQMYCDDTSTDMESVVPLILKCEALKDRLYNQCKAVNLVK